MIRSGSVLCALLCLIGAGFVGAERRAAFALEERAQGLRARLSAATDELIARRDGLDEALASLQSPHDEEQLKTWWTGLNRKGVAASLRPQGDGLLLSVRGPFEVLCALLDQLSRSGVGPGLRGVQYVEVPDQPGHGLLRLKVKL